MTPCWGQCLCQGSSPCQWTLTNHCCQRRCCNEKEKPEKFQNQGSIYSELRMSALDIWNQEKRVLELVAICIISWSAFLEKVVTGKKRVKNELLWTFNHLFNWLIEPNTELKALLALIIVIMIILISLNNISINQVSLERLSNESFPRSRSL